MISSVTGNLAEVLEDRVMLEVGAFVLEVLVPASDVPGLRGEVGRAIVEGKGGGSVGAVGAGGVRFFTILYLEGDSSGGNSEPKLLGFRSAQDKAFFEKFITVKGIGPRKALRALTVPMGRVALAIESRDARALCELPGIGKRMAEQVIAELSGKVEAFVQRAGPAGQTGPGTSATKRPTARPATEEDAILTLMALGEKRAEAETLLERAKAAMGADEAIANTDQLVRGMLRFRS